MRVEILTTDDNLISNNVISLAALTLFKKKFINKLFNWRF